jgi:hypothetical protein
VPSPDERPERLGAVFPAEDETCDPTAVIGASVRVPPAEETFFYRLLLDGEDVTEASRVAEFRTHPRSMAQVTHKPGDPLSAGPHSARIEYSDSTGTSWTYAWSFVVA